MNSGVAFTDMVKTRTGTWTTRDTLTNSEDIASASYSMVDVLGAFGVTDRAVLSKSYTMAAYAIQEENSINMQTGNWLIDTGNTLAIEGARLAVQYGLAAIHPAISMTYSALSEAGNAMHTAQEGRGYP